MSSSLRGKKTLNAWENHNPVWASNKKIEWDWVKTRIGRYPVIVVVIEIIIVKGVTLPEEAKTEFDIVEEALMT